MRGSVYRLNTGFIARIAADGRGLIEKEECVRGLLAVLDSERELNGRWFDYKFEEVPW